MPGKQIGDRPRRRLAGRNWTPQHQAGVTLQIQAAAWPWPYRLQPHELPALCWESCPELLLRMGRYEAICPTLVTLRGGALCARPWTVLGLYATPKHRV